MPHLDTSDWSYSLVSSPPLPQDAPDEVFLEGVLQPALERGRLGMLQDVLEKLDPGLEACSRYLIASCQWLQRRGYFHTLYQIQQFMMVRRGLFQSGKQHERKKEIWNHAHWRRKTFGGSQQLYKSPVMSYISLELLFLTKSYFETLNFARNVNLKP